MDEGIKISATDVLDIIEKLEQQYFIRYSVSEMIDENDYNTVLTVLTIMTNMLEDLAGETYETNDDISNT